MLRKWWCICHFLKHMNHFIFKLLLLRLRYPVNSLQASKSKLSNLKMKKSSISKQISITKIQMFLLSKIKVSCFRKWQMVQHFLKKSYLGIFRNIAMFGLTVKPIYYWFIGTDFVQQLPSESAKWSWTTAEIASISILILPSYFKNLFIINL